MKEPENSFAGFVPTLTQLFQHLVKALKKRVTYFSVMIKRNNKSVSRTYIFRLTKVSSG